MLHAKPFDKVPFVEKDNAAFPLFPQCHGRSAFPGSSCLFRHRRRARRHRPALERARCARRQIFRRPRAPRSFWRIPAVSINVKSIVSDADFDVDAVAGRACNGADDTALFVEQVIDKRRFADIGASDDGDADGVAFWGFFFGEDGRL